MALVKRVGLTAQFIMVSTSLAKSMEEAYIVGMMVLSMMENGRRTRSRALEFTLGWMEESMRVNGWTTIWMEWVCTPGKMADNTEASTKMTRNMAMGSTLGLMVGHMLATGAEANSTVLEPTQCQDPPLSTVSGRRGSALNGLMSSRYPR